MKIIFLSGGARELALQYMLDRGETVIAVVTPLLTKSNARFEAVIKTAIRYGVPVIPVTKENFNSKLKMMEFDLLISCGFPYILDVNNLKGKPAINVHPTLLPKYRGFRSGPFQILNNETESGVTVHKLVEELDKGDILLQKSFKITLFDTTKSVFRKAREIEPELLFNAIQLIKNGQDKYMKQDESESSQYDQIRTPNDSEIDWNKSLKELYNEIRACDAVDYPAFFYVANQKVFLTLWRADKSDNEIDLI